jgi:Mce-associated membrane protein
LTISNDVDTSEVENITEEVPDDASGEHDPDASVIARSKRFQARITPPRLALALGVVSAVALAVLIGFAGVRAYHAQQSADLRTEYLQVGRQGALNLTTIDWQHADDDVQRILDMATGTFYDDFSQRSAPFVDVVKKVQSVSTGTVTVCGLESSTDTSAQVLVAVSVKTTTNEAPEQESRAWRMRLSVEKVGGDVKVSNVEFVP